MSLDELADNEKWKCGQLSGFMTLEDTIKPTVQELHTSS